MTSLNKKFRLTKPFLSTLQGACQAVFILTPLLLSSACSRRYHDMPAYLPFTIKDYPNHSVGRFKTSFLAEQIDHFYRGTNPGPLGVTTFVNVDDLYVTSTFGRVLAEQMMSELAMRGFDVIELRHSDALQFLNPNGEFGLSRDVALIRQERDLGGIVVGTYAVSPVRVYINARLIDPSTSMIVSAGSVEMSKSSEISRLLRGGSLPSTLERIPVRHLGLSTHPLYLTPAYLSRAYDMEESFNWENGADLNRKGQVYSGQVPPRQVAPRFPDPKQAPKDQK